MFNTKFKIFSIGNWPLTLHKNKISNNNENYIKYSNLYDNIINNTTIEKKFNNIVNTRFYDSKEFINSENEEKEWEEDKRLHYQSYFGRYNDLLHIINYYDKLIEEQENKEYNFEDDEKELKFDDEDFDEYYDDYYDENYENEYYEEFILNNILNILLYNSSFLVLS